MWRFRDPSLAVTEAAPHWIDEVRRSQTLRATLRVRPASGAQSGPARILTISDGFHARNLMVGQQESDLIVRLRRPGSDANGMPALVVPDVLTGGRWRDLTVAATRDGVEVRVDGAVRARRALAPDAFAGWDPSFRLALGNEVSGSGSIASAVVATSAGRCDLLEPGRLAIPQRWWQTPERLRSVLRVALPADVVVALLHVLAFAPVGYLLHRSRGTRGLGPVATRVIVLSVVIEVARVLVASRHPSLLNLAAQAAGGVGGTVLSMRRGIGGSCHHRGADGAVRGPDVDAPCVGTSDSTGGYASLSSVGRTHGTRPRKKCRWHLHAAPGSYPSGPATGWWCSTPLARS